MQERLQELQKVGHGDDRGAGQKVGQLVCEEVGQRDQQEVADRDNYSYLLQTSKSAADGADKVIYEP